MIARDQKYLGTFWGAKEIPAATATTVWAIKVGKIGFLSLIYKSPIITP